MEEEKSSRKIISIIMIIFLLLVLALACFFVYKMIRKTENNSGQYVLNITLDDYLDKCDSNTEDTSQCMNFKINTTTKDAEYLTAEFQSPEGLFILYYDNNLKIYNTKTSKIEELKAQNSKYMSLILNFNKTKVLGIYYSEESMYYDIEKNTYIKDAERDYSQQAGLIVKDNNLRFYNFNTHEYQNLDFSTEYKYYELYTNYNSINSLKELKLLGIAYSNESDTYQGYYNLITNKRMYENKYDYYYVEDENYIEAAKNRQMMCNDTFLLNANKEEIILQGSASNCENFGVRKFDNKYYFIKDSNFYPNYTYYTQDKKIIANDVEYNSSFIDKNGILYIQDNNTIKKYNIDGKLIDTDKSYTNLLGFLSNNKEPMITYLENNRIKVKDVNNNEIYDIADWDDNYEYAKRYSLVRTNKNEIMLAIYYKDVNRYDEEGNEILTGGIIGVEYHYNYKTKKLTSKEANDVFTYQALD